MAGTRRLKVIDLSKQWSGQLDFKHEILIFLCVKR